jgi:hypothetical protein
MMPMATPGYEPAGKFAVVYFFSLTGVTVSVSDSLMAPGALMMDIKLLLPIMLRSGKLMAMRNRAKR